MGPVSSSWSFNKFFAIVCVVFAISGEFVAGYYRPGPWRYAHATFYGDETGSETMGT